MADKKTNYAASLKAPPKDAAPDKSKETVTVDIGGVLTDIVRGSMTDSEWARVKQRAVKELHVPTEVSYDEPSKLGESPDKKTIDMKSIRSAAGNLAQIADAVISPEEKKMLEGSSAETRAKFIEDRFRKRGYDVTDTAAAPAPSSGPTPDEWKQMPEKKPVQKPVGGQTEEDNYVGSAKGSTFSPLSQAMQMATGATPSQELTPDQQRAQERLAEHDAAVARVNAQGEQHGQEDLAALKSMAEKGAAAAEAGKQAQDAASPGTIIADQVDRRVFGKEPLIPDQVKQLPQAIGAGAATDIGTLMQLGGQSLGMPNMARAGADLSAGAVMPPAYGGPEVAPDAGGIPATQTPPVAPDQMPPAPPQGSGSASVSAKMPSGFRIEDVSPEAVKNAAESRLRTKTDIENAQDTMAALDIARDGAVRKYAEREATVQAEAAKLSQLATQAKLDSIEEAKGYQARKLALAEQARAAAATPTDPNRYWNNKDAGQKAAAVIAGALFGFTGQGMQWLQRLDGLVEADNRLQVQDRAAKVQGLQAEAEAMGEAGREAMRMGATRAEAMLIDRQTKLEGLKSYLDTMTMKINNMEVKQRGLQMGVELQMKIDALDQQALGMAQQRADQKTEWNYKRAALGQEAWKASMGGGAGDKINPQAQSTIASAEAGLAMLPELEKAVGNPKGSLGTALVDQIAKQFPGTDANNRDVQAAFMNRTIFAGIDKSVINSADQEFLNKLQASPGIASLRAPGAMNALRRMLIATRDAALGTARAVGQRTGGMQPSAPHTPGIDYTRTR